MSAGAVQPQTYNMRTFYTIILTQVFSFIGSRISGLAIGFWIFAETQNATPLALVSFFMIVPQVIMSGFAGVLADRWDRRYVMMIADFGQAVGTLLLLISFASGGFELWHLYVITFLQGIFSVFQGPAFQASVTMLVPDEKRNSANAIQQMTGPLAGIIAPAVAGVVYASVGVIGAIAIDMFTFLVAVLVVFLSKIPRPIQTAEGAALRGNMLKEFFGGIRYLWARQPMFWLIMYFATVNLLAAGLSAVQLPYLIARTGDEVTTGVISGVVNIGALVGAIAFGMWGGPRRRVNVIVPGVFMASIFLVLFGMAQQPLHLGAAAFLFMLPLPMVNAAAMSVLQAKVAPDVQGRVFAVVGQISMLLMPIAFLFVGPLVDNVFEPLVNTPGWATVAPLVGSEFGAGIGLMLVISGVLIAAVSVVVYTIPAIRQLEVNLPDYAPVMPEEAPLSPTSTGAAPVPGVSSY